MAINQYRLSESYILNMIKRINEYKELSRNDYLQLSMVLLSNQLDNSDDRHQINTILDQIQAGHIHFID